MRPPLACGKQVKRARSGRNVATALHGLSAYYAPRLWTWEGAIGQGRAGATGVKGLLSVDALCLARPCHGPATVVSSPPRLPCPTSLLLLVPPPHTPQPSTSPNSVRAAYAAAAPQRGDPGPAPRPPPAVRSMPMTDANSATPPSDPPLAARYILPSQPLQPRFTSNRWQPPRLTCCCQPHQAGKPCTSHPAGAPQLNRKPGEK